MSEFCQETVLTSFLLTLAFTNAQRAFKCFAVSSTITIKSSPCLLFCVKSKVTWSRSSSIPGSCLSATHTRFNNGDSKSWFITHDLMSSCFNLVRGSSTWPPSLSLSRTGGAASHSAATPSMEQLTSPFSFLSFFVLTMMCTLEPK